MRFSQREAIQLEPEVSRQPFHADNVKIFLSFWWLPPFIKNITGYFLFSYNVTNVVVCTIRIFLCVAWFFLQQRVFDDNSPILLLR